MRRLDRMRTRRGAAGTQAQDEEDLRVRIDALEAMVEALQDSVHRETRRQDDRLDELARRLQPSELARSLSDDARKRGL